MKEKKDCNIVQDLLPSYVENLTNEETNQYVEEHLNNCKECQKIYTDMKKKLELHMERPNENEINFLKKYSHKLRLLRIIILILLLGALITFVVSVGRKMIILSDLSHKAEKYESSTNYHLVNYSYNLGDYTKTEVFRLDDRMKMIITKIIDEEKTTITMFGNKKKEELQGMTKYLTNIYIDKKDSKTAILNQDMGMSNSLQNIFLPADNLWHLFNYSIKASITGLKLNGEESYYIANYYPEGIYINKETGLPINTVAYKYENSDGAKSRLEAREYLYEFNRVTEDTFREPSIFQYQVTDKLEF